MANKKVSKVVVKKKPHAMLCVIHKGQAGGLEDIAIIHIMKKHKAKCVGSGTFLPNGERDMEFKLSPGEAKFALKKLKSFGLRCSISPKGK